MQKKIDEIFHWKGFWNCDSSCRMEIFSSSENSVVVATDLGNEGTSITNDAEKLIKLVCDRYQLNPQKTIWIEYYPASGSFAESFSKVALPAIQGCKPEWIPLTKNELDQLIN